MKKFTSLWRLKHLAAFAFVFLFKGLFAQVSGVKTIPTDYASITAFVTDVNTNGIGAGGVTLNVPAGYTETLTARIVMTATGTAANPIIIQKSGTGANPVLTSYVGTNATPSTTADGFFVLSGSDYVTIDGINLTESSANTSATAVMEFGYGLFTASATDGCQNNTIKNCYVTLNRVQNTAWAAPGPDGSVGIIVVNGAASAIGAITPTAASGSNSNNKFYSNTIDNANIGISMNGFAALTPFTLADTGNDVGGTSLATGNNIINFGGATAATIPAAGVRLANQWNANISYNTIDNNPTGAGVNHVSTLRGIFVNGGGNNGNIDINNNTISLRFNGTTSQVSAIECALASGTTNTININNNLITNCTNDLATSHTFYGIYNTGGALNLNINNNNFVNNKTKATTTSYSLLYNTGTILGTLNMNANSLSQTFNHTAAQGGTFYFVRNTGGGANSTANLNNNIFANITHSFAGTNTFYFVANTASVATSNMNNNQFNNLSLNITGSVYGLSNSGVIGLASNCNNNSIITGFSKPVATGSLYWIYFSGSNLTTCVETISNNNFSNISAGTTGSGGIYGIYALGGYQASGLYEVKNIYNNTFENITWPGTGTFYGVYATYFGTNGTTGSTIYNNVFNNMTYNGSMYVFYASSSASGVAPKWYNNVVTNISNTLTTSTASFYGVYAFGSSSVPYYEFYNNKIANISLAGTSGKIYGVYGSSNTHFYHNNYIGDLKATGAMTSTSPASIYGMFVTGGTMRAYNNTVYLNATSTGANFGTAGLFLNSATSFGDFRNNIIHNTSTATGTTGKTAAIQNANATNNNNYLTTSNNNIFFVGTPSASNLTYNGAAAASAFQTLAAMQTGIAGADGQSFSFAPTYLSTSPANVNYLHIDPAVITLAESGGPVLTNFTTDFDGQTRAGNTGYVGTGNRYDIGADEFAGTTPAPVINFSSIAPAAVQCTTTARVITAAITTNAGVITGAVLNYAVNGVAQTPITMAITTGNDWAGTIPVVTPSNATVSWNIQATNTAGLVTGFIGTPYSDDPWLGATASISASNTTSCAGQPVALTAYYTSPNPAPTNYPALSVGAPTSDEDFGNITLKDASGSTILNNTTPINSLVGSIGTATGTAGSYSNFTAFGPYGLIAGQQYSFSMSSLTTGTFYTNSMAIFIDFNRDGDYVDAGEMVYQPTATTSGPHTVTGTFTVPAGAQAGLTRMRVQALETLITSATSISSFGEYEEYAISMAGAPNSVNWFEVGNTTSIGSNNPQTINPTATTSYNANLIVSGCPSTSNNVTVNVLTLPSAPTATASTHCGLQVPGASVTATSGTAGTQVYNWYTDAAGTIAAQPYSYGGLNTYYTNNFTSATLTNSAIFGNASVNTTNNELTLYPNTTSQNGAMSINASGANSNKYQVGFKMITQGTLGNMADGVSFSFGDDVVATPQGTMNAENGTGSKLKVSFNYYTNGASTNGLYLMYNSTTNEQTPTTSGVLAYDNTNNALWQADTANVLMNIDSIGRFNMTINGTAVFTNVQLPAAFVNANKANWAYVFKGRSGGIASGVVLDDILIKTASVISGNDSLTIPVGTTSTFYVNEIGTNGCVSSPLTPVLVTSLVPSPVIATITDTVICLNNSTTVGASSVATPAYNFTWSSLNTTGSGITTPLAGAAQTFTPTAAGLISYVVEGSNGICVAKDTVKVMVNTTIPFNPTVPTNYLNVCNGATTAVINANVQQDGYGNVPSAQSGTTYTSGGVMFDITTGQNAISLDSIQIWRYFTTSPSADIYWKQGTHVGSATTASAWPNSILGVPFTNASVVLTNPTLSSTMVYLDLQAQGNNFVIPPYTTIGVYVKMYTYTQVNVPMVYTNTNDNVKITNGTRLTGLYTGPTTNSALVGGIYYKKIIPTTIQWYAAATGGSPVGAGSPFETVGTTVLPNTTTNGAYPFYASALSEGCQSAGRTLVTVNVAPVNAVLTPVNVTCNGGDNGSFTLGTVACGTGPFTYQVTPTPTGQTAGTFNAIPTNLTAGTYSVVMQDALGNQSAPIVITVTQPAPPANLIATNVNYFTADLSWSTAGNETSWLVSYVPVSGGTPVVATATATNYQFTGLSANTAYNVTVTAVCGNNAIPSAVYTFNTDPGFLAWDNSCGPGFIDISSTGTQIQGITDDSEFGLTLPWPWLIGGTTVNTVTIGNNGGVLFNTLTGQVGYTATGNGMFPFAQDLATITNGGIYYQSIGTAPNRMFVIHWNNIANYGSATPANGATFEIVVMEATNEVYYLYGDLTMGNADDNGADAEVALITANGSAFVSMNTTTYFTNNSCIHFYSALCPNVTNFTAVVDQTTATLDWNPGLYNETAWTVVYGPAGFDPTVAGQAIDTNSLTASDDLLTGLTQLTSYDVYIYSECTTDNLTSDGFFYNFMTLPYCAYPTNITATSSTDTLMVDWDWTAVDTTLYPAIDFNVSHVMMGNNVYTGTENATGSANEDLIVADANLLAGGVYQVYVQAVCLSGDTSGYAGPFTVVMPVDNDTVCGAEMLSLNTNYIFNNTGATVSLDEINIAPPATGAQTTDGWINSTLNGTTWFKFVAPATGSVRINSTGTNYNGQSAVYDVALCSDFNNNFDLIAANDNAIGGTSLAPNYTICGLTPGNTYYIMHDGFTGTSGNYAIKITEIILDAGLNNPVSNICYGDTIDLYTTINGFDLGGSWSAPLASSNASIVNDSLFTSVGLAYQTFNFQYRVVDGCAYDSIVSQVKIFAPSNAGEDGTITACRNEPVDLLSGLTVNADFGGNWYDPSNNAIATSQVTTANFTGSYNYDYIVGNGVCPDDTANVVINVGTCNWLDITEETFAGVEVYPNPTNGVVFVAASINAGNFSYEVTDANGRVIAEAINGVTAAATTSIDLSKVETGVYFIQLSNATAKKVYRIVVQ